MAAVAEAMGHSSVITTKGYSHFNDTVKRAIVYGQPSVVMNADLDADEMRLKIATFVNNAGKDDLMHTIRTIEKLEKLHHQLMK